MTFRLDRVWAIARKDVAVALRSRAVVVPLVVVPVVILGVLPLLALVAPQVVNVPGASDLGLVLERMPPSFTERFEGMTEEQILVTVLLVYLFAPLYLLVPVMVASVLAADAFAGEKERGTLEALAYAPVTASEVFAGKTLAALVPAWTVAWVGLVLYAVVANAAAWPVMGKVFFPTASWWWLAFFVAPGVAALALGATVVVSARVDTFQEAYQTGAVVVVPIVLLVVGQASGVVVLSTTAVIVMGGVAWSAAVVVAWWGVRSFTNDRWWRSGASPKPVRSR